MDLKSIAVVSLPETQLCFGSRRQQKSWRPIFGCSTTNSEEFQTVKSPAEVEIRLTPPLSQCSTRIWLSTFTTIPTTNLLTRTSSTHTSPPKRRLRWTWNRSGLYRAVQPSDRVASYGSRISCSSRWIQVGGLDTVAVPIILILIRISPFRRRSQP